MAGVHAEIRTMFAQSAHKYIVASRICQGNEEFKNASPEEREDIEMRWVNVKDTLKGFKALKQKEKGKLRDGVPSATEHASTSTEHLDEMPKTGWFQNKNLTVDEKKRLQEQKKAWRKKRADGPFVDEDVARHSNDSIRGEFDGEFETYIQAAVQETSRGDAVEDARIEQALRSSVRIMRKRSTTMSSFASTNSNPSNAGAQASGWVPDVKRQFPTERREYPFSPDDLENITDEEYQALIEEAIKVSLTGNQHQAIHMQDYEEEDDGDDEHFKQVLERSQTDDANRPEDDEEYKKALKASQTEHETQRQQQNTAEFDEEALRQAIEASQVEQVHHGQQSDDDEELKRALEESEKAHQEELARLNSLRSEEDIVLEYVKKQSLAEAAIRNGKGMDAAKPDDDEELKRALEESMKTDNGIRRGGGGGPSQP
jgi:hypothetical protein